MKVLKSIRYSSLLAVNVIYYWLMGTLNIMKISKMNAILMVRQLVYNKIIFNKLLTI